jgi:hypothetical protein
LLLYSSHLPLGVPNWSVIYFINPVASSSFLAPLSGIEEEEEAPSSTRHQLFSSAVAREEWKTTARGVFCTHILYFVIVLLYFIYLTCIVLYQKPKKFRILGSYFYLSAFSFAEMANPESTKLCEFTSMNNSDFICTPIAPPAPAANFYEIKPALLNLVMKE